MSKRDKVSETLDAVALLAREPDDAALVVALRPHLASKVSLVVAKAAKIAGERKLATLSPELAAAFERFLAEPIKSDPGCGAKTNVIAAGVHADCLDAAIYLRAIRHRQLEGPYPHPFDYAAVMRGHAAYGLLNVRHPDALYEIVALLDDTDSKGQITDARRAGIRALGTVMGDASVVMLRMTARRYANDPETLGEAFTSLNAIEPVRSFDFIAGHLDTRDVDLFDTAAIAVAESRQPTACDVLIKAWPRRRSLAGDDARAFLTAVAMTRRPAAADFLIDRVANGSIAEAKDAIEALALFRSDQAVRVRLAEQVHARGEPTLTEALHASTHRPS